MRDTRACTHCIAVLMANMRRSLALLQGTGEIHHQLPEMHDAEIHRAEMLAGAAIGPWLSCTAASCSKTPLLPV